MKNKVSSTIKYLRDYFDRPYEPIVYMVSPQDKVILDEYYKNNPSLIKPNYQERTEIKI